MSDLQAEAGPSSADAPAAALPAKVSTIPIRLISRSDKHAIPESKYMVPSDWRRFQLSELINKVLGNDEQSVPFDFILGDNELLRSSLAGYTEKNGLTEETILDIEYVESILPPKYLSSFEHEDWVSDVELGVTGSFLTSSYDSNVRIFSATGLEHTLAGHTLPVLSASWLSSASTSSTSRTHDYVASGGMDRVIRVWQVPVSGTGGEVMNTHALSLHTGPVSSVRSTKQQDSKSGRGKLLSAGWDGLVGYWDFSLNVEDADADDIETQEDLSSKSKKRRKGINGAAATNGNKVVKVKPTIVLPGHSGQVSRAIFSNAEGGGDGRLYSFGYDDHSVREWDLESGGIQTSTKVLSDRAILDGCVLSSSSTSQSLLATANSDKSISILDLRETTNSIISLSLTGSHTSSVSSVSAHPTNSMLLASGSYDGTTRVWDLRSPKQALFAMQRQKSKGGASNKSSQASKILCTAWDGEILAAGGEDGKLELMQSKGV